MSDVLYANEKYEEALVEIEKALAILIPLYTINDGDSMCALYRKAKVLFALGRYEEAKNLARQSAEGYAEFFGIIHPNTCGIYELLGDVCLALELQEEAQAAYRQASTIAEQIYGPDGQRCRQLANKLHNLQLEQ